MIKTLIFTMLTVFLTSGCGASSDLPVQHIEPVKQQPSSKATPEYVQGQLIIQFVAGLSEEQHLAIFRKHALHMVELVGLSKRLYLVQIEDGKTVEEKQSELENVPEISITEPNFISRLDDK